LFNIKNEEVDTIEKRRPPGMGLKREKERFMGSEG
jgi:hypothetical protein